MLTYIYVLATLLDIRTSFCALIRRRIILMVQTSAWASCNAGYGFPLSSKTNISKFQFDLESGRRRTTLWMCYLQISIYLFSRLYYSLFTKAPILSLNSGLLIFRGKKSKILRDFQGQIRGIIGRFRGRKVKNLQKSRPISRDFSGKKSNFKGFSGANSQKNRPLSREISGGNFAKKQSVKNSRFGWIFFGKFR